MGRTRRNPDSRRSGSGEGLLDMVLHNRWLVAGSLVLVTAVVAFLVLPALPADRAVFAWLSRTLSTVLWLPAVLVLLVALIKYRLTKRRRSELQTPHQLIQDEIARHVERTLSQQDDTRKREDKSASDIEA